MLGSGLSTPQEPPEIIVCSEDEYSLRLGPGYSAGCGAAVVCRRRFGKTPPQASRTSGIRAGCQASCIVGCAPSNKLHTSGAQLTNRQLQHHYLGCWQNPGNSETFRFDHHLRCRSHGSTARNPLSMASGSLSSLSLMLATSYHMGGCQY